MEPLGVRIVMTFAVVASVVGAGLEPKVIVIVGSAALVADGFSMAVSSYLGTQSDKAVATGAALAIVGSLRTLVTGRRILAEGVERVALGGAAAALGRTSSAATLPIAVIASPTLAERCFGGYRSPKDRTQ